MEFAFSVQGTGGLIEQQNLGIFQHRPGNGEALALAAGQANPLGPQGTVIAPGQLGNELVGMGRPGRGFDVFIAGIRSSVGDVVTHTAGEQHRTLGHQGDAFPPGGERNVSDVMLAVGDLPRAGFMEALQQFKHRGLAGTRLAHQGQGFTRRNGQVKAVQCRLLGPGGVGKGHLPEGNGRALAGVCRTLITYGAGFAQQLHQPLGSTRCPL